MSREEWVYVIKETGTPWLKVGVAIDPYLRLEQLQTGNPRKLELAFSMLTSRAYAAERRVHRELAEFQGEGEWFSVPLEDAKTAIQRAILAAELGEAATEDDPDDILVKSAEYAARLIDGGMGRSAAIRAAFGASSGRPYQRAAALVDRVRGLSRHQ